MNYQHAFGDCVVVALQLFINIIVLANGCFSSVVISSPNESEHHCYKSRSSFIHYLPLVSQSLNKLYKQSNLEDSFLIKRNAYSVNKYELTRLNE